MSIATMSRDLCFSNNPTAGLERSVEKIAQSSRGKKGPGAGPVWNMKGGTGVSANRGGIWDVVVPKGMFDDPAAHRIDSRYATFGIDEKILSADRTADPGG